MDVNNRVWGMGKARKTSVVSFFCGRIGMVSWVLYSEKRRRGKAGHPDQMTLKRQTIFQAIRFCSNIQSWESHMTIIFLGFKYKGPHTMAMLALKHTPTHHILKIKKERQLSKDTSIQLPCCRCPSPHDMTSLKTGFQLLLCQTKAERSHIIHGQAG